MYKIQSGGWLYPYSGVVYSITMVTVRWHCVTWCPFSMHWDIAEFYMYIKGMQHILYCKWWMLEMRLQLNANHELYLPTNISSTSKRLDVLAGLCNGTMITLPVIIWCVLSPLPCSPLISGVWCFVVINASDATVDNLLQCFKIHSANDKKFS